MKGVGLGFQSEEREYWPAPTVRNLLEALPGQAAQLLWCLYLQHRLEMLQVRPDVALSPKARPYTVCGSWEGIDLK